MTRLEELTQKTQAAVVENKMAQALVSLSDPKWQGKVNSIPIELIDVSQNTRAKDDENTPEFIQLLTSIKEVGLLHPPVVAITPEEVVCIAGHRRIHAYKTLGHTKIACLINHTTHEQARKLIQLSENTVRKNLAPLELAQNVDVALDENKFSMKKLSEILGKDRKYVERLVKINRWPAEAKLLVQNAGTKATLMLLFRIAGRRYEDDAELIESLKSALFNVSSQEKEASEVKPMPAKNIKKMNSYFEEQKVSEEDRRTILTFLQNMGIKGWVPQENPLTPEG